SAAQERGCRGAEKAEDSRNQARAAQRAHAHVPDGVSDSFFHHSRHALTRFDRSPSFASGSNFKSFDVIARTATNACSRTAASTSSSASINAPTALFACRLPSMRAAAMRTNTFASLSIGTMYGTTSLSFVAPSVVTASQRTLSFGLERSGIVAFHAASAGFAG